MMEIFNLLLYLIYFSNIVWFKNVEAKLREEGIIGGQAAREGQFKFMVSVQANNYHVCGGAIIDDRFVLTAAHCIIGYDNQFKNSRFSILAGVINFNDENGLRVQVQKGYVMREFAFSEDDPEGDTFNLLADIAVLLLHQPLGLRRLNSRFKKLDVPKVGRSYPTYENEKAIIPGFGYEGVRLETDPVTNVQKEVATINNGRLTYAETRVVPNVECTWNFDMPVNDAHICAQVKQRGNGHKDSVCVGDSGGPLVYNGNLIIGILSSGPVGCEEANESGIYTRVASYATFIRFAKEDMIVPTIRTITYNVE